MAQSHLEFGCLLRIALFSRLCPGHGVWQGRYCDECVGGMGGDKLCSFPSRLPVGTESSCEGTQEDTVQGLGPV